MKFSITGFFSKCDQIRRKLQIWSYLLKKSLIENFIFCAVKHKGHTQKDNTRNIWEIRFIAFWNNLLFHWRTDLL